MIGLTLVWAQVTGANASANSSALALLSLRRWYSSLTLSSPEPVPSHFGLWAWLVGLAVLWGVVLVLQGPTRALRQGFDIPGLFRLIAAALQRLRRAGRVVAVAIGMTVLSWTLSQLRTYHLAQGKDDLVLLTKARGLGELAVEQGIFAALTPLRDLAGLADNLPLLLLAAALLFRRSAERWSGPYVPLSRPRPWSSPWVEVAWLGGTIYLLYRMISLTADSGDLPMGGCLIIEFIGIPALMLLLDGVLLSWVLVELRNAGLGDTDSEVLDAKEVIGVLPGGMLACLTALPARYLATAVLLFSFDQPSNAGNTIVGRYVRWQLHWGLADVQGGALVLMGLAGAAAWNRGNLVGVLRAYLRMLRGEGGRLALLLALTGATAGALSALAYVIVLSLPAQTWVLAAADGYAHYATLPVGLVFLAALVELGERSLPVASLVTVPEAEPALAAEESPDSISS